MQPVALMPTQLRPTSHPPRPKVLIAAAALTPKLKLTKLPVIAVAEPIASV